MTAVRARFVLLCLAVGAASAGAVGWAAEPSTLRVPGLADDDLATALRAAARARAQGLMTRPRLVIVDYAQPSTAKRLWVVDPDAREVRFNELVAHGKGSGENFATVFGNEDGSERTSLGVFRAAETYIGRHGLSLRLDGLDPGTNDRARARTIVIHAADYVSPGWIATWGRLGRSFGCPALEPSVAPAVILDIREGGLLVAFGPDDSWVAQSPLAKP
jgi:hypothetical protein